MPKRSLKAVAKSPARLKPIGIGDLLDLPVGGGQQLLGTDQALLAQVLEGAHPQVGLELAAEPRLVGADPVRQLDEPGRVGHLVEQDVDGAVDETQAHLIRLLPGDSVLAAGEGRPPLAGRLDLLGHAREQVPLLQVRADPRQDLAMVEGLGDVVHAAGLEALELLRRIAERGEKDHRDGAGRRSRLEAPAGLVAVPAGHQDVQQDQVGSAPLGLAQAIGPVAGDQGLEAQRVQLGDDGAELDRLVVDDEDRGRALLRFG